MKRFLALICLLFLVGCAKQVDAPTETVDPYADAIDLTQMFGDEVYHTLNDIMHDPEPYLGKAIIVGGVFDVSHTEGSDDYFPVCLIDDGDGCNADVIEFVLFGDVAYPDPAYPDRNEPITVIGTLATYEYEGATRCHLVDATLQTAEPRPSMPHHE